MEPHRTKHRIVGTSWRRQAGITAIGFLVLASVFGVLGFAGIKLVPLYLQTMRLSTVLGDLERDYRGAATPVGIRNELESRLAVESLRVPRDNVKITQIENGYQVRIQQESRAPFLADLWFLVVFDEQVEIRR